MCYRFVDRDMFMRFRGGGVGHRATRQFDGLLQRERHTRTIGDDSSSNTSEDVHDGDDVTDLGEESSTADDDNLDYSDTSEESEDSNDSNVKSDDEYSDTDDDENGDEPTDEQILAAEGYAPF
jgi:hypothetical protein